MPNDVPFAGMNHYASTSLFITVLFITAEFREDFRPLFFEPPSIIRGLIITVLQLRNIN